MIVRTDRRRFLKSFCALGLLCAAPALARNSWDIQGSDRGTLRLVFFTDIHGRPDSRVPEAMAKAAAAINEAGADLVLCGGDLIDGGFRSTPAQAAAGWDAYMTMHRSIRGDVHTAIGNHDLVGVAPGDGSPPEPDPKADFRQRLGLPRTYGAFDAAGYRIIILDSVDLTGDAALYRGWVDEAQLAWLEAELSGLSPETPIVLITHLPLLTAFFAVSQGGTVPARTDRVVVNNRAVLDLFADRNLVLVLQGHTHVSEMIHWRSKTFLTGGAISANWWRGPYFGTEEGFSVLTLHRDHVDWDYVDYGWEA